MSIKGVLILISKLKGKNVDNINNILISNNLRIAAGDKELVEEVKANEANVPEGAKDWLMHDVAVATSTSAQLPPAPKESTGMVEYGTKEELQAIMMIERRNMSLRCLTTL